MTDWPPGNGEMCRRIREHDWAATPLGPAAQWPQSRKTAVELMLASGHAMLLALGEQRVILYNDAYAPMLGARHPQALGIPLQDAWPEVWDEIAPMVAQVFRGETVRFDDLPLVMTRHGYPEETWWSFSYSPVRDESGAVVGLLNVTVDATPLHRVEQAEAAMRRSDEQRVLLLDAQAFLLALSDALRPLAEPAEIKAVATRLLGERLGVNRAFYADAGNDQWLVTRGFERDIAALPEQPFGMADYGGWIIEEFKAGKALVVDDMGVDARFSAAERQAHLALQIRAEIALPLVKKGRLEAMLVVHAAEPRAWSAAEIALLEEAAKRTWAAVERALAEAALHAADRRKDEFLAVLAHELRNGLAPLVYNAELANRSQGNPALLRDLSARAGRQLQHLVHLVDDLLDVARINTGKIQLKLERVTVRDVVDLALDACRADADRKRQRLTVVDEAGVTLVVHGDRERLTQVVSNLLSNASKYTEEGGTTTVRMARDGDDAVIEVSDTGIGIPPAALPLVFDLFSQVRNQQAYTAGGLGIGLSLVKQLAGMHGGSVRAASEGPGRGSTFTVRLPVAAPAVDEPQAAPPAGDAPSPGRPLRVLVVDDHQDAADALAQLLDLEGHDAQVAYCGEQALAHAHARRPDLVLLDLGMPRMDGFEVASRLRADFAAQPRMHIVAVTGWGQESDRQRTKAASFDGHLAKPPSHAELLAVLSATAQTR